MENLFASLSTTSITSKKRESIKLITIRILKLEKTKSNDDLKWKQIKDMNTRLLQRKEPRFNSKISFLFLIRHANNAVCLAILH